jgi:hypothetical protein
VLANRKWCELQAFWGRHYGFAQWADKKAALAFPASFYLVHFFWRSKRNEHLFPEKV